MLLFLSCQKEERIEDLLLKINQLDPQITSCLKTLDLESDKLCSVNVKIDIAQDLKKCMSNIEKEGFKAVQLKNRSKVKAELFESTKKAVVDFEEKKVYFRYGTSLADCAHEYVHVMQYNSSVNYALTQRRLINNKIQKILNKEVEKVVELEKAGKEKELMILSGKMQKYINQVKNFNRHSDGLDEIEAYLFVLRNCDILQCSQTDEQIALSNLYKRSQYLEVTLQKEVQKRVFDILNEKRKIAYAKAIKVMKDDYGFSKHFKKMYSLSWKNLFKYIKSQTNVLKIYRIKAQSNFNYSFLDAESIPLKDYKKIPVITTELRPLIGKKILQGQAYGKHVCQKNRKSFIILNKLASKLTLIHEYFHFLQQMESPRYCFIESDQREIKDKFDRGVVDLETYESTVLFYQALNDVAEMQVYEFLATQTDKLKKFEKLNTIENLKRYKIKLEGMLPR